MQEAFLRSLFLPRFLGRWCALNFLHPSPFLGRFKTRRLRCLLARTAGPARSGFSVIARAKERPKPISPARFWQQVSPTRQFVACKSEAEAKRFYARLITFFKAHHAIVSQEEAHLGLFCHADPPLAGLSGRPTWASSAPRGAPSLLFSPHQPRWAGLLAALLAW